MWPLRTVPGAELCEKDVRSWMDRCVRAFGQSPIRWRKLSAARQMADEGEKHDDRVIDAIVEEITRALASPTPS